MGQYYTDLPRYQNMKCRLVTLMSQNDPQKIVGKVTEVLYQNRWVTHSLNDNPSQIRGTMKAWHHYGVLHRDNDEPAIDWENHKKVWYQDGRRHRWGKPAEIYEGGKQWYYLYGIMINDEIEQLGSNPSEDDILATFMRLHFELRR